MTHKHGSRGFVFNISRLSWKTKKCTATRERREGGSSQKGREEGTFLLLHCRCRVTLLPTRRLLLPSPAPPSYPCCVGSAVTPPPHLRSERNLNISFPSLFYGPFPSSAAIKRPSPLLVPYPEGERIPHSNSRVVTLPPVPPFYFLPLGLPGRVAFVRQNKGRVEPTLCKFFPPHSFPLVNGKCVCAHVLPPQGGTCNPIRTPVKSRLEWKRGGSRVVVQCMALLSRGLSLPSPAPLDGRGGSLPFVSQAAAAASLFPRSASAGSLLSPSPFFQELPSPSPPRRRTVPQRGKRRRFCFTLGQDFARGWKRVSPCPCVDSRFSRPKY